MIQLEKDLLKRDLVSICGTQITDAQVESFVNTAESLGILPQDAVNILKTLPRSEFKKFMNID